MASVTIGSFSEAFSLTAQPVGYSGSSQDGLTARQWAITGLLTPAQWASLVGVYNTWRDTRITDADTLSSAAVGTTVALTVSTDGVSVSALACWFESAPKGERIGAYMSTSVVLIDAAQALAVLLRSLEKSRQNAEAKIPTAFGTYTLGSAVLTLTKDPDAYQDAPQLTLTSGGTHYLTGPLGSTKLKQLEGYISSGTKANVDSWYGSAVTAIPSTGAWFPISPPVYTAEVIIVSGAKSTRYTVTVTLAQVR